MNVVSSAGTHRIYGDFVQTSDHISPGTYEICFTKMGGFYLSDRNDLVVKENVVYGEHEQRADKILRGFHESDRNFGVILSGQKGCGKSLLAKVIAKKAIEAGIPMIISNRYYPGIDGFIASIEQEVVVLFDEFEKTYKTIDDVYPQEEMLSLFDGIDGGKKLFLITCNDVSKLNSFFLNRPGRFHYHFVIGSPSSEDIRNYLQDKLLPEYHHNIDKVISFSMISNITYDILRAITFELNLGYSFEDSVRDLNISKGASKEEYVIEVVFDDGAVRTTKSSVSLSLRERRDSYTSFRFIEQLDGIGKEIFSIELNENAKFEFDITECAIKVDPKYLSVYVDEDYYEGDAMKELYECVKSRRIVKFSMLPARDTDDMKYEFH